MGLLLDLLGSAAGEGSLHSSLGRWRQKVSELLDGSSSDDGGGGIVNEITVLQQQVANLSKPLQYMQVSTGAFVATPLSSNSDIVMEQILVPSPVPGISYDTTTSTFTLTPGVTYRLQAHGRLVTFNPVDQVITVSWFNADTNAFLNAVSAVLLPVNSTINGTFDPIADAIFTPTATSKRIKLRIQTASGTAINGGFSAIVNELR